MSTIIFDLAATPDLINASNGEQEITISWTASMTAPVPGDNPVYIELNLDPGSEVDFISSNNQRVKTVAWQQNFQTGVNNYQEILVVVCEQKLQPQHAGLRMDIRDSAGYLSHDTAYLIYQ